MTVREILRRLQHDGWIMVQQTGSHRQFKHLVKRGRVTVAGKPSLELPPKTLKSIRRQAGWEE